MKKSRERTGAAGAVLGGSGAGPVFAGTRSSRRALIDRCAGAMLDFAHLLALNTYEWEVIHKHFTAPYHGKYVGDAAGGPNTGKRRKKCAGSLCDERERSGDERWLTSCNTDHGGQGRVGGTHNVKSKWGII